MTLCQCGCGRDTLPYKKTEPRLGPDAVKGAPARFLKGHNAHLRTLTPRAEKRCPACGQTKPLTPEFWFRDRGTADGFASPCKQSRNQASNLKFAADRQAYQVAYAYRNRHEKRVKCRRWRALNYDKALAQVRAWYRLHPGLRPSQKTWRAAHPEQVRLFNIRARARRRALETSAPGHCTQAQLEARIAIYGHRCWICHEPWRAIDHVKPLCRGGSNWPSNLRPICGPCNSRKSKGWPITPALIARCLRVPIDKL